MIELVQAAQPQCFPPAALYEALADAANEAPVATGESENGQSLTVLFISKDGATWTLVVRSARVACIVATGKNWQETPFKPKGKGA